MEHQWILQSPHAFYYFCLFYFLWGRAITFNQNASVQTTIHWNDCSIRVSQSFELINLCVANWLHVKTNYYKSEVECWTFQQEHALISIWRV